MKKTLIALAVLAASGASFAQVTIYGAVSAGYQASKANTTVNGVSSDVKNDGFVSGGAIGGDRIGFKGTEDLGGGLKANFVLEGALNTATGVEGTTTATNAPATNVVTSTTSLFDRESNLGLSGSFGSFTFGRTRALLNKTIISFDALDQQGITVVNLNPGAGTRVNNSATYLTPALGGFNLGLQYSALDTGTSTTPAATVGVKTTTTGASVGYSAGPFAISLAFGLLNSDQGTGVLQTSTQNSGNALGASYDFGAAKVFGLLTSGKAQANTAVDTYVNNTENSIGLSVPVGAISLVASLGRNTRSTVTNNVEDGTLSGTGNNYALAAFYNLSKRTVAFVKTGSYLNYTFNGGVLGSNKIGTDATSIGLRHSF